MKRPEIGDKVLVPAGTKHAGEVGDIFGFKMREENARYPQWAKVRIAGNEVFCPNIGDLTWDDSRSIWTVKEVPRASSSQ